MVRIDIWWCIVWVVGKIGGDDNFLFCIGFYLWDYFVLVLDYVFYIECEWLLLCVRVVEFFIIGKCFVVVGFDCVFFGWV